MAFEPPQATLGPIICVSFPMISVVDQFDTKAIHAGLLMAIAQSLSE
jgi:hypothetical protein